MNSVIADLAICLKLLGRWSELNRLLNEEQQRVEGSPVLLDIKIGMLVASGEFGVAEKQIAKLRAMPFDDGRADCLTATILMNRDRNFKGAQGLLSTVLARQTRGALGVRRLRALAAARGRDFEQARLDSDHLRNRPGGHDTFRRIEAEIKLAQQDYVAAESEIGKVRSETAQDRLLRARILEAQGLDMRTPLHLRNSLRDQAASIRRHNQAVDEYDFDG